MKKLHTDGIETIIIGKEHIQVTQERARAFLTLLRGLQITSSTEQQENIPASEIFKDEISKYTKPGLALRGARLKEDMSQVELAKKLGISQTDLSKMEYGKRSIGKKMAKRLSKILNIDYRIFL